MKIPTILLTVFAIALTSHSDPSAAAPSKMQPEGSPGAEFTWSPACKQAIGTAYEHGAARSPVWFTLSEGVLTEIFYPTIDQPQTGDFQFIVTGPNGYFSEQRQDTVTEVRYQGEGMAVEVSGHDRKGHYRYEQRIVTDPDAPVVRVQTRIFWNRPDHRIFVLFNPAIHNGGRRDLGWARTSGLLVTQTEGIVRQPVSAAVVSGTGFSRASAGYAGTSDGWQILKKSGTLSPEYPLAGPGNIALTGEIPLSGQSEFTFDVALAFGGTSEEAQRAAETSLKKPFAQVLNEYGAGWSGYALRLRRNLLNASADKGDFLESDPLARQSAQILKMHEDKTYRGAMAAALCKPGIPYRDRAEESNVGGYHLVWPRDLYHSAMALMAAGDFETANWTLKYFVKTQNSDGSWWQNYWLDGTAYWQGVQMDEIAFPILLAWQVHKKTKRPLTGEERRMVQKAADFLVAHGPSTQQDRWEEIGGYVPSTVASEIAALRAAAVLLDRSQYAGTAENWVAQIEKWMLRRIGPLGRDYFVRTSPSGDANRDEDIWLANGMGQAKAAEIIDGGFLELVRLGILNPFDPSILSSLAVYENPTFHVASERISENGTAQAFRRYNRDGYGHQNQGGYWPLLAGERGHYAVAAGDIERAKDQLKLMKNASLKSGNIPEQTFGVPSAAMQGALVGQAVPCPLAWSHGEYLLLSRSLEEGAVFDAP